MTIMILNHDFSIFQLEAIERLKSVASRLGAIDHGVDLYARLVFISNL